MRTQRAATAAGRGDPGRQAIEKGEYGRALDYDIELQFAKSGDAAVVGKLIGTTLPKEDKVDRPLKRFPKGRQISWEFPNTQPWNFAGELSADGTAIAGVISSIQGGIQVAFRKQ